MPDEHKCRPRDAAVERIEYYILQNQLQDLPSTKLPSERDMCEMWEINRTTLRSAIHRLVVAGKLYNRIGSGTYIAPPKMERNLQDLKALSVVANEHKLSMHTQVLSHKRTVANKNVSKKLHILLGSAVLELRRLRSFDGKGAILETNYVSIDRFPHLDTHDFIQMGLYQILSNHYQCQPCEGQEKMSITCTDADEARLLQIDEGTPVIYQSGVVSDIDGVPIEFFKAIVRSDLMCFTSKLTR